MPSKILYDGECGLCHGFVRFVVEHDREAKFVYAPQRVTQQTVIVLTESGVRLERSDAALYVLFALGGRWAFAAALMHLVPRVVRDAVYAFIARIRYRVFGKRTQPCPLVSPELRKRFLAESE